VSRHDGLGFESDQPIEHVGERLVGTDPAHRRRSVEQQVAGEQHPLAGNVHDRVARLMRCPEVENMRLRITEVQHETLIEDLGR
jgi:hypothetical protein